MRNEAPKFRPTPKRIFDRAADRKAKRARMALHGIERYLTNEAYKLADLDYLSEPCQCVDAALKIVADAYRRIDAEDATAQRTARNAQ